MKSIIFGAQGLVGSALGKQIPTAQKYSHSDVDITKYEQLLKVFDSERPQIVYLPAALTNVDECENLETNVVNIRGAVTVLRLCEQFESKFVYFSSSYVFDGESPKAYLPDQETNPINNYGKQKDTVERLALESDAKILILRTVGVFGIERKKKNFAKKVISTIFGGKKVIAPNDQYMNPILSNDLARISIKLAERSSGVWHVAGDTCLTKAEFATKIARYFDLADKVMEVSSEEMQQPAKRPKMGCLDCSLLKEYNIQIPSLDAGLAHFLESEFNG